MEYKKERLIMIICLALFLVCMWLIVMGQKKDQLQRTGNDDAGINRAFSFIMVL